MQISLIIFEEYHKEKTVIVPAYLFEENDKCWLTFKNVGYDNSLSAEMIATFITTSDKKLWERSLGDHIMNLLDRRKNFLKSCESFPLSFEEIWQKKEEYEVLESFVNVEFIWEWEYEKD